MGGNEWNVDNYYNDLRNNYLKAAQKEVTVNNFKKTVISDKILCLNS